MNKIVIGTLINLLVICNFANSMTFRATISGAGVWNDAGVLKIKPNQNFNIEVYATNNDTINPPITIE